MRIKISYLQLFIKYQHFLKIFIIAKSFLLSILYQVSAKIILLEKKTI